MKHLQKALIYIQKHQRYRNLSNGSPYHRQCSCHFCSANLQTLINLLVTISSMLYCLYLFLYLSLSCFTAPQILAKCMLTIGRTTRTAFACYFRNVAKHLRYSHKDFYVKYKDSFYEKNGHHEANVTIDPVYAAIFNDVSHIAQTSFDELASFCYICKENNRISSYFLQMSTH